VSPAIDLGITIERVRVRTRAPADDRPPPVLVAGYLGASAGAPPHDHRIVIRELRIDVEAELDAAGARILGNQVAHDLAGHLAELQAHRPRIAGDAGPIHVETVRVRLWGHVALHPSSQHIAAALIDAFEEEVRDAT
jgi:hypothetical protein